jgi:hypothetical protein
VKVTISRVQDGAPVNVRATLTRDVQIDSKTGTPRKRVGTTELAVLQEAEEPTPQDGEQHEAIQKEADNTKAAAAAARKLFMEREAAATKAEEERKREEEERKLKRHLNTPAKKVRDDTRFGHASVSPAPPTVSMSQRNEEALQAKLKQSEARCADLLCKLKEAQVPCKLCDVKTDEIASLRRDLDQATQDRKQEQEQVSKMKDVIPERDQLATELDALKGQLKSKDAEILMLKNEVSAASASVQKLQEALVGKDAEIETFSKALKEVKASDASVAKQPDTESVPKATEAAQISLTMRSSAHSIASTSVPSPELVQQRDREAKEEEQHKENNNVQTHIPARITQTPSPWPQYAAR